LRDQEETLVDIRRQLGEEQRREGQLVGEEQAYHKNVARRDALVREISKKNGIKGFDHNALDKAQWSDFRLRMNDHQRSHIAAAEGIQAEGQARNQEFTLQLQTLHANIATLKAERESLQKQIVGIPSAIIFSLTYPRLIAKNQSPMRSRGWTTYK